MHKKAKLGRIFIGRFDFNNDLLFSLNEFCKEKSISAGIVSLVGALQNAKFGFYDQKQKKYRGCVSLNKRLEIVSCSGNISSKENRPFAHLHIVVADLKGKTFGGHLMEGSKIFACEFSIIELKNISLKRTKDTETGLPLWK